MLGFLGPSYPCFFYCSLQRLEEISGKEFQSDTLISDNVFFVKRPLIRIYGFTVWPVGAIFYLTWLNLICSLNPEWRVTLSARCWSTTPTLRRTGSATWRRRARSGATLSLCISSRPPIGWTSSNWRRFLGTGSICASATSALWRRPTTCPRRLPALGYRQENMSIFSFFVDDFF